jgi:hypothetical protein
MKKIIRTFHLLLVLSLVLLPMRAVMAGFPSPDSVMPAASEAQVADHHVGVQSHHADHERLTTVSIQADESSTDCHDHNMSDCEACALHFTVKNDIKISELSIIPTSYADYSVLITTPFLPSDIRPPIL